MYWFKTAAEINMEKDMTVQCWVEQGDIVIICMFALINSATCLAKQHLAIFIHK